MSYKRVKVDWYKVLYSSEDPNLINYFWFWFNTHKVKSKRRAARCVLVHYYSTITPPEHIKNLLCLNSDIRKAQVRYSYE